MRTRLGLIACLVTVLVLSSWQVVGTRSAVREAIPSPSATSTVPTTTTTSAITTTTTTAITTTTTKRVYASSAELPDGGPIPEQGAGTWHVVPGTSAPVGSGTLHTYVVEVEDGVRVDEQAFGQFVQDTLADPRGWTARGGVALRRVDSGPASMRVRLTSMRTARALCGYEIPVDVSCRNGGRIDLSAARWVRGAVAFDGDLVNYRRYVINHEVGHALGQGHQPCAVHGGLAPVMMQQTFSTSNDEIVRITAGVPQGAVIPADGKVCAPNPWPFP
ncbi:hypothetical protein JOF41_003005 [Saccharothrix coeruleofusca]|uniref:DUF3152 domain-containing protein n=1 Tax=Saccharothrix coeruleofusca TaxID=33919 RepID=UPI001AE38474|nr:DUF3152 domain-containing protein [Saccharothrix coeruleofusca]MBP2336827.1 hypothetical protein [Saccharothrix coeruleofusca]